ncbi:hypothetical protein IAU59_005860 [Kwoniella sp. CBS 9459]
MPDNKTTENILALVGAVLWAIQGIPQVLKTHRAKSTKGLSPYLMLLWMASGLFFCTYVVAQDLAIPAIVQPHISMVIYAASWGQCLYYSSGYSLVKTMLYAGGVLLGGAVFEGASVAGLLAGKRHGTEIPIVAYGYMSTVLAVIGILPQYYEIYKQKEVIGLSIVFVLTNLVGAVFLIAALFMRDELDTAGLATYALTSAMVLGIVILALILNPLAAKRRRLAALPSPTQDTESAAPSSETTKIKHVLEKGLSTTANLEPGVKEAELILVIPQQLADAGIDHDEGNAMSEYEQASYAAYEADIEKKDKVDSMLNDHLGSIDRAEDSSHHDHYHCDSDAAEHHIDGEDHHIPTLGYHA